MTKTENLAAPVPQVTLGQGYSVSRLIKGGWQLSGDHGTVEGDRAVADMIRFARAGVTTFDCADIYTGVEEMIGRFLAALGSDAAGIKVHTKYVPDRAALAGLTLAQVEAAIDRALGRLGRERLDLVQFHWWDYAVPGFDAAFGHLATLQAKGKIDRLGVTNFDAEHLQALCAVAPVTSAQVQISLLDARTAGAFAQVARSNGVALFSYGVLAGGFLSDAWLGQPDPGHEFENRSLVKYRLIIDEFGGWDLYQALLAALRGVADAHETDIATVAVAWVLDNPDVTAAIVGARYADRLPATLRALDLKLTQVDRAAITAVLDRRSGPKGPVYGLERESGGVHGAIMKNNLNQGDDRLLRDDTDAQPAAG